MEANKKRNRRLSLLLQKWIANLIYLMMMTLLIQIMSPKIRIVSYYTQYRQYLLKLKSVHNVIDRMIGNKYESFLNIFLYFR